MKWILFFGLISPAMAQIKIGRHPTGEWNYLVGKGAGAYILTTSYSTIICDTCGALTEKSLTWAIDWDHSYFEIYPIVRQTLIEYEQKNNPPHDKDSARIELHKRMRAQTRHIEALRDSWGMNGQREVKFLRKTAEDHLKKVENIFGFRKAKENHK